MKKVDKATETVGEIKDKSVRTNSVKVSSRGSVKSGVSEQSGKRAQRDRVFVDFQHHKKKTDVTWFANASFNGGVFLNAVPGQSI